MSMLKLNADFEDALNLASCYGGATITQGDTTSILKGVDVENNCFIGDKIYAPMGFTSEDDYQAIVDEITIDTSVHQPCIYACMRDGLSVEVETINDEGRSCYSNYYFNTNEGKIRFLDENGYLYCDKIKSIKILDVDKMEGVEVT